MEVESPPSSPDIKCLKCQTPLSLGSQHCDSCGYSLPGVGLYNPQHFVWLAVLFTALVPIYLAAANWGKIGNTRAQRWWLGLGFLGFTLLFSLLALQSDNGRGAGWLVGWLIHPSLALWLREKQRPLYAASLRLGAQPGSLFKGWILGMGFLLGASVLPVASSIVKYQIEFLQGAQLIAQGQYEKAAPIFERILRQDPDDADAVFNLALCHLCLEQWEPAAEGLRAYLKQYDEDPDAHAYLGYVLQEQGQEEEAERHFAVAERLDPEVLTRLFGPE